MKPITDNNVARLVVALKEYDKKYHTFNPLTYNVVKSEMERISIILLQRKNASIDDRIGTLFFCDTLPDDSRQLIKMANVLREQDENIELSLLYLEGKVI